MYSILHWTTVHVVCKVCLMVRSGNCCLFLHLVSMVESTRIVVVELVLLVLEKHHSMSCLIYLKGKNRKENRTKKEISINITSKHGPVNQG